MTLTTLNGVEFVIDDEDLQRISSHRWFAYKIHKTYYVMAEAIGERRRQRIYLHRVVMNATKGTEVDHINGDGLNNRKQNLRICSHRENLENRHSAAAGSLSGVLHVHCLRGRNKPFYVRLKRNGRIVRRGYYLTVEEARAVAERIRSGELVL